MINSTTASSKEKNVIPNDCSSNKSVHLVPAEIHVSAGPSSYVSPQLQPLQQGMMDLLNYSTVPSPSQRSDSQKFVSEAVEWSLNVENLQTPAASVCSPPRMQQQCEGEASVDPSPHNNFTVPILGRLSTGGLVWLRNPFQPQYQNLHPAPAHMNENWTLNKDFLGTHSQGDFTGTVEPPAPPAPSVGAMVRPGKSKKTCHCTKSQCLKLYCSCFANGLMCNNCRCSNCFNNEEHKQRHLMAIQSCQKRNPNAFRPKVIQASSRGVEGRHAKGCKCKRCYCLKDYCECFEAHVSCTPSCRCAGCMNRF